MVSSDGIIGVHGNALTHSLWLPAHAICVEIFASVFHHYDYQVTNEMSGHYYAGIRNGDKEIYRRQSRWGAPFGRTAANPMWGPEEEAKLVPELRFWLHRLGISSARKKDHGTRPDDPSSWGVAVAGGTRTIDAATSNMYGVKPKDLYDDLGLEGSRTEDENKQETEKEKEQATEKEKEQVTEKEKATEKEKEKEQVTEKEKEKEKEQEQVTEKEKEKEQATEKETP